MFSCFQSVYFCAFSKKISTFSRSGDWSHAQNYVAKRYIEKVDRDVYFQDVRLQMDAKVWGEEYNRHNPPKKVESAFLCWLKFSIAPGLNLPVVIDKKYHTLFFLRDVLALGPLGRWYGAPWDINVDESTSFSKHYHHFKFFKWLKCFMITYIKKLVKFEMTLVGLKLMTCSSVTCWHLYSLHYAVRQYFSELYFIFWKEVHHSVPIPS